MASPPSSAASLSRAATTAASSAALGFRPRQVFEASPHITRSYFLGHHHAGLERMRRVLSNVGLIIECRDFRVPLTSWNPLLERTLASSASPAERRARIVVYTKRDLGPPRSSGRAAGGSFAHQQQQQQQQQQQDGSAIVEALRQFHREDDPVDEVVFLGQGSSSSTAHRAGGGGGDKQLLDAVKRVAREADVLTGLRALVVGMPNAGKSTLLNRLRARGMGPGLAKAARTGAQPGVTRKLSTPVRIVAGESHDDGSHHDLAGMGEGVFVVDTPGVFVPYVSDPESMLKLALAGCVKDGLVPHVTVADYLLFHLNLRDPAAYTPRFLPAPTNDVAAFLDAVARRTGKLRRGGAPSLDAAADWVVQEWRRGGLGRFVLDDVLDPAARAEAVARARNPELSWAQARKREKEARRARSEARRSGSAQDGDSP